MPTNLGVLVPALVPEEPVLTLVPMSAEVPCELCTSGLPKEVLGELATGVPVPVEEP